MGEPSIDVEKNVRADVEHDGSHDIKQVGENLVGNLRGF